MLEVVYADEFVEGVSRIWSNRVLDDLNARLEAIERFPELGSTNVRPSLVERFGPGLRKYPVSSFVIVYRYLPERERLEFLALPNGRTVR